MDGGASRMLRGHQTLVRLVGKRRRLDALCISSLSRPENACASMPTVIEEIQSQGGTLKDESLSIDELGGSGAFEEGSKHLNSGEHGKENTCMYLVPCPVCGKVVPGDDHSVNMHLDLCLMGKSTSKSNQLTLSQFGNVACPPTNSSSKHKQLTVLKEKQSTFRQSTIAETMTTVGSSYASIHNKLLGETSGNCMSRGQDLYKDLEIKIESRDVAKYRIDDGTAHFRKEEPVALQECMCSCHFHTHTQLVMHEREEDLSGAFSSLNEAAKLKGSLTFTGVQDTKAECADSDTGMSCTGLEMLTLETFIVGRKFNRLAKVEEGMKVRVLRDPENPKDANAIKIVQSDGEGSATVGHLPREVALHLSGLIDKGFLSIQGVAGKIPEKKYEAVPVKLLCKKTNSEELGDSEWFESTWHKVLEALKETGRRESANPTRSKYVENFVYILNTVLARDSHLFNEEELSVLGSFATLTENAQCLFVRLFQRKGPWFQVSQISYQDVDDAQLASKELLEAGFATAGDTIVRDCSFDKALRERLQVLHVPELKQLLSMAHLKIKKVESGTPRREDLLDLVIAAANEKHNSVSFKDCSKVDMLSLVLQMIGPCIRISDMANFLVWRLQRIFFLNGEQDTSAFLLVDMGAIKYPSYKCYQTRKVFPTRDALLEYEQALEVAQTMDMALESNEQHVVSICLDKACMQLCKNNLLMPCDEPGHIFLARFTATWVFATVASLGVSVLERERRYIEAVDVLKQLLNQCCCPGKRGYWTVRLSMDLEHLGRKDESLETAEAGLCDPKIRNGDRVALQRRVLRLGKPPRRWKKPPYAEALARSCKEVLIRGRPLNCQTGFKSRFYGYDGKQCSVEELALQYYAADPGGGWQGFHSENGVWMTLFSLLMWDVLFADVPNVFWHPFQSAPLDLNTDAFYPGREALIEAQLERICLGEASQIVAATWSKWFGTLCMGLNWERHSLEELQVICTCVGGCGLASICRLLAEDHAGWAGGMPDLLLWRIPNECPPLRACSQCCCHDTASPRMQDAAGEAKLVEVKGPRDRLSEQQRAWIHILMQAGICVEVCKVLEEPKSETMDFEFQGAVF